MEGGEWRAGEEGTAGAMRTGMAALASAVKLFLRVPKRKREEVDFALREEIERGGLAEDWGMGREGTGSGASLPVLSTGGTVRRVGEGGGSGAVFGRGRGIDLGRAHLGESGSSEGNLVAGGFIVARDME